MAPSDDTESTSEWEIIRSDELYSTPYFRFRRDTCALPDERVMPPSLLRVGNGGLGQCRTVDR